MKPKDTLLLILAALQPITWWAIYQKLDPLRGKITDTDGLGLCCSASAILIMALIIIPIIREQKV